MKRIFLRTVREKTVQLGHRLRETRLAQAALRFFALCERHSFLTQCLLVLLLRMSIDVLYVTALSPRHAYAGFTTSIQPLFYLCTWLALLLFTPVLIRINQERTPASLIVTILNYTFFIPMTSYCGCHGSEIDFFLIALVYWAALLFFQLRVPVLVLKRPVLHISRPMMKWLTLFFCVFILYISGRYTGFRFTMNFFDVYRIRLEARTYPIPTLFSYLLSAMAVIMTLLLLYWMARKKWLVVAVLCVVYIFLFSIGAHKTQIFLLFLTLFCFFFYHDWMFRWAGGLLTLMAFAADVDYVIGGSMRLLDYFFLRMLYLPPHLCTQYQEFFRHNPMSLNRSGIMGKLSFEPLYSTVIPRILGEYRGHPAENADTGLLGDLFSNMPLFPGIVLLPLILVICFRLLDMASASLHTRIILPICLYFASAFLSGNWSVVLLTNGFLITCLLLYVYPNEEGLSHG